MDRISGLSDELLVKILSFSPTKVVVSTSVLSKRWESLWMSVPKLEFRTLTKSDLPLRDFITKNLSLLKPPVLESFRLLCIYSSFQPEDIKHWVESSLSRCVRELDINYFESSFRSKPVAFLPTSLYTSESLVYLKLRGYDITVDVPRTVYLPSLKTLELDCVMYAKEDSLQLLLSYCPVLEDLVINREADDNVKTMVIHVKSLLRLMLPINGSYSCDGYVIVTPSLKHLNVWGLYREYFSCFLAHMPNVEEVDLTVDDEDVERLFDSITSVKRLSLTLNNADELMYRNDIVFDQLEYLELWINHENWSQSLVKLLEDSPKLRVLKIYSDMGSRCEEEYESLSWYNDQSVIPTCLLESLETFEFARYKGRQEEIDFVNYILKNARRLKPVSIKH